MVALAAPDAERPGLELFVRDLESRPTLFALDDHGSVALLAA
jgi:hypothetical protein